MDIETIEVIGRLGERIDGLGERMGEMRLELRGEMRAMGDDLRGEMRAMGDDLRGEMQGMRQELRAELRDGLSENRRHADVLFERLRDDIRIVAEGLATVSAKIDSLRF